MSTAFAQRQVSGPRWVADLDLASQGYGGGSAGRHRSDRPDRACSYRLNCRPALAEIVGDGRPWTVLMISLLSMPCR